MTFVLWLHVAAAIFLIGPVTVAMSAAPRAAKAGADGLSLLRWLHRTTRLYGFGSLAVLGLGLLVVPLDKDLSMSEGWLSASMAMFVVAFLLVLFSMREQARAITTVEGGSDPAVEVGRMSAVAGFAAALWVTILLLMVWQPGS